MKKYDYVSISIPVMALFLKFIPAGFFKSEVMNLLVKEILPVLAAVYLISWWSIVWNRRMKKTNLKCRFVYLSKGCDISTNVIKYNFSNTELRLLGFSKEEINQISKGAGMLSEISASENYIARILYE